MNVTRFAQATKYGIDVDSGIPKGNMYHIACSAWFTSTGQTMPRYFKFEDDAGEVQTVKDILVKYTEEKNYSGIPSREYGCEAVIGGLIREFKLIFSWRLVNGWCWCEEQLMCGRYFIDDEMWREIRKICKQIDDANWKWQWEMCVLPIWPWFWLEWRMCIWRQCGGDLQVSIKTGCLLMPGPRVFYRSLHFGTACGIAGV